MVVAGGVEGELAEELSGLGVDDPDVAVGGEQDHSGAGVGLADADVVEPAVVSEGDDAGFVDDVVADAVVGRGEAAVGGGAGSGGVGVVGVRRASARWGRRVL